jgi:hypothetical protein
MKSKNIYFTHQNRTIKLFNQSKEQYNLEHNKKILNEATLVATFLATLSTQWYVTS